MVNELIDDFFDNSCQMDLTFGFHLCYPTARCEPTEYMKKPILGTWKGVEDR
jgi:hypothetical protein